MKSAARFGFAFGFCAAASVIFGPTRVEGAPVIVASPASVSVPVGGVASFRVVANGVAPLAYQWLHDAQLVAGATSSILTVDQLAAANSGRYSARVTDATGVATSAEATLTVTPATGTPIVDPTFQGDARLDGLPTAILPLADGRMLVADGLKGKLVRLLADGRLDSSFTPGAIEEPFADYDTGFVEQIVAQPDGRVLVAGFFASYSGVACPGLVRLNADGSVDRTFVPAESLMLSRSRSADGHRVAVQPDGKILYLDVYRRQLVRLMPDGSIDPGFRQSGGADVCSAFDVAADGRIYVIGSLATGGAFVARLQPDGSEDSTFARKSVAATQLFALADGRLLVTIGTVAYAPGINRPFVSYSLVRWFADGSVDATFPSLAFSLGTPPAPDGTLFLYDGSLVSPDGSRTPLNFGASSTLGQDSAQLYSARFGPDGRLWLFGGFSFFNGVSTARVVRLNRVPSTTGEVTTAPAVLAAWADSASVTLGDSMRLHVAAIGPGPVTYQWLRAGNAMGLTNAPEFNFVPQHTYEQGDWTVRVINSAGAATSQSFHVTVNAAALRVAQQPSQVALMSGRDATLTVTFASGSEPTDQTEVWRRNGSPIAFNWNPLAGLPSATVSSDRASLDLGPATPALAGTYTVTVRNALGQTVTSDPIVVTVDDVSRFVNLSTRAWVGPDDQAAVLGFIIPPGNPRSVVLRGIGPTLASFGVAGVLADARLEIFDSTGRRIAANDNWTDSLPHRTFGNIGAFDLPSGSRDAVIDFNGPPGSYTVRLSGPPGVTGVGLIELYEADNVSDRLLNISSRVFVGPAATPAIAGFAIRGSSPKRVLIRAAGPALVSFGLRAVLPNPRLEVRDNDGRPVAANDDWENQPDAAGVASAIAHTGAFAFAPASGDAALTLNLPPGNYSAIVSDAGGGSGVALIEVYEIGRDL